MYVIYFYFSNDNHHSLELILLYQFVIIRLEVNIVFPRIKPIGSYNTNSKTFMISIVHLMLMIEVYQMKRHGTLSINSKMTPKD